MRTCVTPVSALLALCAACSSAPVELDAASRVRAEALAVRLRCTACHSAEAGVLARLQPEAAPDLAEVGARTTPAALREWLLDPHATKPGSAMPDLLARLEPRERTETVDALVQFLASLGGPLERQPVTVDLGEIERGRQLFHSVGCVACHRPQESAEDLAWPLWTSGYESALAPDPASDLARLARATSIDALARFLVDPLAARPSGRMPALRLTPAEAHALATYLLRGQAQARAAGADPGWSCELYEGEFSSAAQDFEDRLPLSTTTISDLAQLPPHPEDHFALALRGFLNVEQSGLYEFSTRSDDGSLVYVDGKLVVSNDGVHPPSEASGALTLERGLHGVLVKYFENEGGEELAIRWQPPGRAREVIPARLLTHSSVAFAPQAERFEPDARLLERGRRAFAELGCAACHTLEGLPSTAPRARPFAELAARVERGCLADPPGGAAPRFDLEPPQRASLRSLAGDLAALAAPRTSAAELEATLARLDCRACHARNGSGGPNEELRAYFKAAVEVDLGNEGRLPPHLDAVGSKLYAAWMQKVLAEGALERPYVATRMPQYGARNVAGLGALFERVDGSPRDLVAPAFSSEMAEAGRKLAGAGGLLCIQCHVFDGVRSLGIPAVDLAHVRERIKPAWFERLLLDPKSLGMNTRMPIFWDAQGISAARTILDGDPQQQAEALWSYVSLGRSMPLPDGLVVPDSEYELTPTSGPILCGVFLKNASPRTLMVGNPELVHYAFDLENSRLVCAWRGRFFNARGTWDGRAGGLEWPQSDELCEFDRTPALAFLASRDAPWPTAIGREAGFHRLGTRYDAQRHPTFRYRVREVEVAESCVPLVRPGAPGLRRVFDLRAPGPVDELYLHADPRQDAQHVAFTRAADGHYAAHVELEVSW